jgi:molybdopterin converting factor small subunit
MPIVHLNYLSHIIVVTGKSRETIDTTGQTIYDLISELNEKYPGIKNIFVEPESGILNVRTMIHLERSRQPLIVVMDLSFKIEDGDIIYLW